MHIFHSFAKRLPGIVEILAVVAVFSTICFAAPAEEGTLLFQNDFERGALVGATRIAVSRSIGGRTHVGLVDIDSGEWFDMTEYLDQTYGKDGDDRWLAISNDLGYYIMETERAGYSGWSGLVWGRFNANGEPSKPKAVDGRPHPEAHGAISRKGTHIAITLRAKETRTDIILLTRNGDSWDRSRDINLSAATGRSDGEPQFSVDGNKVIWTSSINWSGSDSEIVFVENNLHGDGYKELLDSSRLGSGAKMLRPSYEANGKIIFEGEVSGELCYRWDPSIPDVDPKIINSHYSNDNSCRSLPDGRIISYWMGRQGSAGHELRVMLENGVHQAVLLTGTSFWDFPISGGTAEAPRQ